MRWSISNYADRVKSFGPAHPQFEPKAVKKGILGRIEIEKLAEIAQTLVNRWKVGVVVVVVFLFFCVVPCTRHLVCL